MRNPLAKRDQEIMTLIRQAGFVCRELNGEVWLPTGHSMSRRQFKRLLDLGLLQSTGDSLFDGPSQTYIPKEEVNVQTAT